MLCHACKAYSFAARWQDRTFGLSCNFQKETFACEQKETGILEDWAVQEHHGFGCGIGRLAEVIDVSVWAQAADHSGPGWHVQGVALGADGNFAVVADADAGALAPDKGPPRAGGRRSQHRAFFGEGLVAGGLGRSSDFAVDFMGVGMRHQLIQELVGTTEFEDVIGGQEGGQAFLPVVVAAFDFALGLGRGGVAEVHAIEVEGRAQLGKGVGVVGVEEGVVVHVERQGQTVGLEDAGQEVEVGQQGFLVVEAGAGIEAGGVVEEVEQDLFVGGVGQPGVGAGIVLPEGAQIPGLPAFDRFRRLLVTGVGGQLVLERPAADAGAVGQELETAVEFAGTGAVGGRGLGGEERGEQGGDLRGPVGMVIAAGAARGPGLGLAVGAGVEVLGIELVEAAACEAQFRGSGWGVEMAGAKAGQKVTNEGRGTTMN